MPWWMAWPIISQATLVAHDHSAVRNKSRTQMSKNSQSRQKTSSGNPKQILRLFARIAVRDRIHAPTAMQRTFHCKIKGDCCTRVPESMRWQITTGLQITTPRAVCRVTHFKDISLILSFSKSTLFSFKCIALIKPDIYVLWEHHQAGFNYKMVIIIVLNIISFSLGIS